MTTLLIANKCYSSWSLRPWLLMTELGLAFEEVLVPLGAADFRARVLARAPGSSGKLPCLVDGEASVWESLAIMEHSPTRIFACASGRRIALPAPMPARSRPRCIRASVPCAPPAP